MAGDEHDAHIAYNCQECRDAWKIARKCPKPMKDPKNQRDFSGADCVCPLYGVTAHEMNALRCANLVEAGVINPLDECDGWFFEATEHVRAERARLTREKMKAR